MDIKQCDKCSKTKYAYNKLKWKILEVDLQDNCGTKDIFDLCPECYKLFKQFIVGSGSRIKTIRDSEENEENKRIADEAVKEALGAA